MKNKIIALLLVLVMAFGTVSCTSKTPSSSGGNKTNTTVGEKPDGYSTTTVTNIKKGEVEETEVPVTVNKTVSSTTFEDSNELVSLSVDNSVAIMKDWQGFNAVHQGFIFIPDQTDLGRTYTDKMIEEELNRIDEMDISMLRSYYEPYYSYKSGSSPDTFEWDWDSEMMNYLYSWLEACQKRGITIALQMAWSAPTSQRTTADCPNPFYGLKYSDLMQAYGEWVAESIYQIVDVRGFTNVKYAVVFTEPLYIYYGGQTRSETVIKADNYSAAKQRYMAVTDDGVICTTDVDTCDTGKVDAAGKHIYYSPTLYDINTDEVLEGVTGRVFTGWDSSVEFIKAADKYLKLKRMSNGTTARENINITGPQAPFSSYTHIGPTIADDVQWWVDKADKYIDVYTFHWYAPVWPGIAGSGSGDWYDDNYDIWVRCFREVLDVLDKTGKPYWFDEYNYAASGVGRDEYAEGSASNPLNTGQLAQAVIAAMNTGVSNCILWQLFEIAWPFRDSTGDEFYEGIHVIGSAPPMFESSVPYIMYQGVALMAKYAGGNNSTTYLGTGEDGVYLSMVEYEKNGKKYKTVMVLNTNFDERKVDIKLSQSLGGVDLYRYLHDPSTVTVDSSATMIGADIRFTDVTNRLQDTIPAGALVFYSTEYSG